MNETNQTSQNGGEDLPSDDDLNFNQKLPESGIKMK